MAQDQRPSSDLTENYTKDSNVRRTLGYFILCFLPITQCLENKKMVFLDLKLISKLEKNIRSKIKARHVPNKKLDTVKVSKPLTRQTIRINSPLLSKLKQGGPVMCDRT